MRRFMTIFALTIFLSLLLSFTLSCARNTSSGESEALGSTEGSTAPPVSSSTEEALPPPADDLIYMIREASGCGHPHERVFRNPIHHSLIDFPDDSEFPASIDAELLNELVITKLNDVYLKQYPNNTIVSADIKEAYLWTYEDVQYVVVYNIRFNLDDGDIESSENLILLVPGSLVTQQ